MRPLCWLALGTLLTWTVANGAGETTARAAAERAAAEERYRILRSSMDELMASQLELRERLDAVTKTLQRLAVEAQSKPSTSEFVTRQEFDQLVATVKEIDRKRVADHRKILAQIEDLGKELARSLRAVPSQPVRPGRSMSSDGTSGAQEGVEYIVEDGNTLSAIIEAHNAAFKDQGLKTSLKLILDANRGLEPRKMQVGRKLFIPMVPIKD